RSFDRLLLPYRPTFKRTLSRSPVLAAKLSTDKGVRAMSPLEALVNDDVRLPSPPGVAVRIIEILQREDFTFNQLGAVIQSDPALVAKILRLVNSGYYAVSQKVGSIDMAIALLGINAVKNIALSFTIPDIFKARRVEQFDFNRFWRRSVVAAVAAELISAQAGFRNEDIFITALLQDIGVATMFTCRKDDYEKVLDCKLATGLVVTAAEKAVFGFDHQEAGSALLQKWGLPESVYLPIRYHHDVDGAALALRPVCNVLRASDRISA